MTDEQSGSTATETADVSEEEFAAEQAAKAEAQGLPEGSVPEQRPQAIVEPMNEDNELTAKLKDAGVIDTEPMGKEAYDRASSSAQAKKAAKTERQEGIAIADFVKVTNEDSPHFGRIIAVTRVVEFGSNEDVLVQAAGLPEQLYTVPKIIEGRDRGSERDGELLILDVDEHGLEKVRNWRGTGRG